MAPTPLPFPYHHLQKRIDLLPSGESKPNYWLALIILAGITGFACFAALVGCLAARCCKAKRRQTYIGGKSAIGIEKSQRTPETRHSASRSSHTLQDDEDDMIEQRTAEMMAVNVFAGREQKVYADDKKAKLNQGWTSSSIAMPVSLAELKGCWQARQESRSRSRPDPAFHATAATPEPQQNPPAILQDASAVRNRPITSTDYDDPAELVESLRDNRRSQVNP